MFIALIRPFIQEGTQIQTFLDIISTEKVGLKAYSIWKCHEKGAGLESGTSGLQHQLPKPLGHATLSNPAVKAVKVKIVYEQSKCRNIVLVVV